MRRAVLIALCLAAWLSGTARAQQVAIPSKALGATMHAIVVLPAGYATSRLRYPVVYFLHGLPAWANGYLGNPWLAPLLAAAGPAILVEPQGSTDSDRDPEYLDWGPGRDWATFETQELVSFVDQHYRTIRSRAGRALVGLSAGGYGAAMLGLNHLREFSVVEAWSGYFHPTDPTGQFAIDAPATANVHSLVDALPARLKRDPTFLAFYVGGEDPVFVPENEQLDEELTEAGIPHTFAIYPGGHDTSLWQAHAVDWLQLALAHLLRPA